MYASQYWSPSAAGNISWLKRLAGNPKALLLVNSSLMGAGRESRRDSEARWFAAQGFGKWARGVALEAWTWLGEKIQKGGAQPVEEEMTQHLTSPLSPPPLLSLVCPQALCRSLISSTSLVLSPAHVAPSTALAAVWPPPAAVHDRL